MDFCYIDSSKRSIEVKIKLVFTASLTLFESAMLPGVTIQKLNLETGTITGYDFHSIH
jgi:hypothetical protein